jgi:hypothetical protein
MAKKRRAHDEEPWMNARKICRLTDRQVEMARALGMNPKKLPGLRPSPQERWKLPVGEFIEELHRKRFGSDPRDGRTHGPEPDSRKPSSSQRDAHAPERVTDVSRRQAEDLVCYFVNLADDLQKWLAHGTFDPEVLPQVIEELREIAGALETGAPISAIPEIPVPPRPTRRAFSRRRDREQTFDDEIPF